MKLDGAPLANLTGASLTYTNNLERIETIRSDGKIDGADPTIAALSGSIEVRFADTALLPDPQFRNDSLYRTPTHLLRTQGPAPLFRLRLHYDATGGDDRRILSLGGFQIREGSERIAAGGRELRRGVDYTVNYEIGQVTFVNPDSLFRQPTTVTAQYEENPAFTIAPTSLYGVQARYDLGDRGPHGAGAHDADLLDVDHRRGIPVDGP